MAPSDAAGEPPDPEIGRSVRLQRTTARRGRMVWLSGFGVLFAVLALRNAYLFHARIYENGDFAANSVIIGQAKHFTLLVGNYSRLGFNHPGPVDFYVQAAGEWLFHDLSGVVPTPYNGQLLAVFILNAALIAAAILVVDGWTQSTRMTAACSAVILTFIAIHPMTLDSSWMPWVYCPAYLLLTVSAASVAAGRGEDLWRLALAGGLLVHGHVSFLVFVPVVAVVAASSMFVIQRRFFGGRVVRRCGRELLAALSIVALFLAPIVLNLALHWPGEFSKYLNYQETQDGHHHSLDAAMRYALNYWVSGRLGPYAFALGTAAAVVGGVTMPKCALRRFCVALVAMSLLTTLFVVSYAHDGIDNLQQPYVAYFAYLAPALTLMALVMSVAARVPARLVARIGTAVSAGALTAAVAGVSVTAVNHYRGDPALSDAVAALAQNTAGRPALLDFTEHDTWADGVGLLVLAKRRGVHACVTDPSWSVLVRPESICTAAERATGVTFDLRLTKDVAPSVPRLATLRWTVVTLPASSRVP